MEPNGGKKMLLCNKQAKTYLVRALKLSFHNTLTLLQRQSVRFWLTARGTSLLPHLHIIAQKPNGPWSAGFSRKLFQKYGRPLALYHRNNGRAFTFSYENLVLFFFSFLKCNIKLLKPFMPFNDGYLKVICSRHHIEPLHRL